MSPFARQTILWMIAAAFVASLFAYVVHKRNQPAPVALAADLIGKFEFVAFGRSGTERADILWKRALPLFVIIRGTPAEHHRHRIDELLRDLSHLTGFQHRRVEDARRHTAAIYLEPGKELWGNVKVMATRQGLTRQQVESSRCFALPDGNDGILEYALVGIAVDQSEYSINSCMQLQLVHSLGLYANTEEMRPSVFSFDEPAEELTLNDKILVRAFYDPAITPGMKKGEVMRIVPGIIEKLVERVKTDGESALIHPRYVAR